MYKYWQNLTRSLAVKAIRAYQKTFSFDHGPLKSLYPHGFCRFYPSCSQYSLEAIEKYGIIRGGVMAMWRVLRCNPWNKGGHDPVK